LTLKRIEFEILRRIILPNLKQIPQDQPKCIHSKNILKGQYRCQTNKKKKSIYSNDRVKTAIKNDMLTFINDKQTIDDISSIRQNNLFSILITSNFI
jgi:catalase